MNTFRRRIYHRFGGFLNDFWKIVSHPKEICILMRGKVITPSFRERIMLVVTSVNQCRYCSYAHARVALSQGIPEKEIDELGKGMLAGSPSEEVPALLYAQHWAETNGEPDEPVRNQVITRYGRQDVEVIDLVLRIIRLSNLSGNTLDYLLHKISFGRWGAWK